MGHALCSRLSIVLECSVHLPPILPHSDGLYSSLRSLHTVLAFVLFATFLVHVAAALMHGVMFRDGVFQSMASWQRSARVQTVK